jgi:crotonobetainyl-CoA:carnitine CoA-transferase CaiB-like acyl-CoA transferase
MTDVHQGGGPLAGLTILDLSTVVMGPYASMLLADLGARVIKIESPEGDTTRQAGRARHPGMGSVFLTLGRGKRSLVLDLKAPGALEVLLRLVERADGLLMNMRPEAADRLGLTRAALAARNPNLVLVRAQGFLEGGPYSGEPAYDDLIQGLSGTADVLGRLFGEPAYVPMIYADKTMGLMAALAMVAALLRRARGGRGELVEVPMFEGMVSFTLIEHLFDATFDEPGAKPGYPRVLTRERRPFRTRDGYLCALPYTDRHFQRFFASVGRADLAADARFASIPARLANIEVLYALLGGILAERTNAEWLALMREADIPCMPVKTLEDLLTDPHLEAVGLLRREQHPTEGAIRQVALPLRFHDDPPAAASPAPRFGEHSRAILAEAGFDAGEIAGLLAAGVVRTAP